MHWITDIHMKKLLTSSDNTTIPGNPLHTTVYGMHPSLGVSSVQESSPARPLVPIDDRLRNWEALTLAFAAKNSLSLSKVPKLIDFAKALGEDKAALDRLSMDQTTASYKLKYGLANTLRDHLLSSLRSSKFSFNIDEATSKTDQKVLVTLVSHFSQEHQRVVVYHLDALTLTRVTAETVSEGICGVMEKYNLPWSNLMSVLMDSCAVIRGSKSGVETRLRWFAPHLINIDGDTVHHAHNTAKKFCTAYGSDIHHLFQDLHTEFKWSTELKDKFFNIRLILGIKPTAPQRYAPHRWLSILDISLDTVRLYDALFIYFFSFIRPSDRHVYKDIEDEILKKHAVTDAGKRSILSTQEHLRKKWGNYTQDGKNRKERCCTSLVMHQQTTCLTLAIFNSILPILKEYVIFFQSQEVRLHRLHDKQEEVLNSFLSCFIKPSHLACGASKMKKLNVTDVDIHLPIKSVFTGSAAVDILQKMSKSDRSQIQRQLLAAYVACAQTLQEKMPLANSLLKSFAALDPVMLGSTETLQLLSKLKSSCNLIPEDQRDAFDMELRNYNTDKVLRERDRNVPLDTWWASVDTKRYPVLTGVVKSLLSCFHGPAVESFFSVMSELLDVHSSHTDIETYASYQLVKSAISAEKTTAVKMFKKTNYALDHVDPQLTRNMKSASFKHKNRQELELEKKADRNKSLGVDSKEAPVSKSASKKTIIEESQSERKGHKRLGGCLTTIQKRPPKRPCIGTSPQSETLAIDSSLAPVEPNKNSLSLCTEVPSPSEGLSATKSQSSQKAESKGPAPKKAQASMLSFFKKR